MSDDLERMLSGGAKSAKFEQAGDTISGTITEIAVRQATEFGTNAPQFFDNGDPKEQIVVIIKADGVAVDDDDDGHRAVYIKGWGMQRRAFIEAVRHAGIKKPAVGDRFTATLTGMKPSDRGGFPAKVYEYRFQEASFQEALQGAISKEYASAFDVAAAKAQAQKLVDMGGMSAERIAAATSLPIDEVQEMMGHVPF